MNKVDALQDVEQVEQLLETTEGKGYKRYSEYKDSGVEFLGEVPKHWSVVRLKFLLSEPLKYGANEAALETDPSLPRFVRITDIDDNGKLREETFKSIPEDMAKPYLLDKGDILFARSGATAGKTFYYELSWGRAAYAGYLIRARLDPKKAYPKFLWYFTRSDGYWQWASSIFIQATIMNISAEKYANLWISLPPISEQQAIARFLDEQTGRIDELIAAKRKLLELLHEKRRAIVTHAVTKGLDPDVPMKDSGVEWLGEVPEHWGVIRLKYLAKINPNHSQIKTIEDDDEVSFVPMEAVQEYGGLDLSRTRMLEDVRQGFTYFEDGDVIVAKITPCFENGKGSLVEGLTNSVGFGSTELHVIRPNIFLNNRFLFYLTISQIFRWAGTSEMVGAAGQKRVPTDFVNNYPVSLPSSEEQQDIVQFLDSQTHRIDSIVKETESAIERLNEFRSALISSAVTGKIDVRDNDLKN